MHPAELPVACLLSDCSFTRTKGRGPGGQHPNKVETAVVVTHLATGIRGAASERRSQHQNRQAAIFRLRLQLALEVRTLRDPSQVPSQLWQDRAQGTRLPLSGTHNDFPAILSELLDVLHNHQLDFKLAATQLGSTPSQLVRILKRQPAAWQWTTTARADHGLPALR